MYATNKNTVVDSRTSTNTKDNFWDTAVYNITNQIPVSVQVMTGTTYGGKYYRHYLTSDFVAMAIFEEGGGSGGVIIPDSTPGIATTLASLEIKINRVFFDEIDSISNIICTKINSDFIWFVSASFNIDYLGYYKGFLTNMESINNITCKCDNDFIDANIFLDQPIKTYCLCKNIYIDNILGDVISNKELK